MNALMLILLGFLAGTVSGMGIGGGAILIPALTMFFGQSQHAAQNINLIYFIPTAAFAIYAHGKSGRIERRLLPKMIIGGIVGAVLGSVVALNMQADVLKYVFAGFLLVMGVVEIRKKEEKT
ncbi:MAG: sulfite exporter TauE/SafE family protein [Defluviitaleaceae bacterium]|nr:sulfite exporter TauE/SafE family protein [Defluviitaleaceae bacterium]